MPRRNQRALQTGMLFLLLAVGLSGCVTLTDIETSQEHTPAVIGTVSLDRAVGQSFVSRRSGLNNITVWLNKPAETGGAARVLLAELYLLDNLSNPVFSTEVYTSGQGAVSIALPPRRDPPGQAYYLELKMRGGDAGVLGRAEDAYPYGDAYAQGAVQAGDIAFRTTYSYDLPGVLGDLQGWIPSAWLLLPLAALLVLPGWLLLDLSGLAEQFDGGERASLSVGLSLALVPVLMLWTSLFGLRWSRSAVLAGVALLLLIALVRAWRKYRRQAVRLDWASLLLAVIFVLVLGMRLAMARDLTAPAWVDSVHHALISRLIIDQGAVPGSYAPYADIPSTQYHLGFHAGLASFHWLSGLAIPEALFVYGQVLNALSVAAVYQLAVTLVRRATRTGSSHISQAQAAGLFAALVTGFLTPMPAYYTSWGRYTQLAGLLILPAVPALVRLVIEDRSLKPFKPLALAGIALAGLLMVHYRVAAFAACLLAAYVLSQVRFNRGELRSLSQRAGLSALSLSGGAVLLTLPWILPTLSRHIVPALETGPAAEIKPFADFAWRFLTAAMGQYSLGLAAAGILFGLINRRRFPLTLLLWTALLFLLANLGALGLPGAYLVNNTSVAISLFMPISVAAGYALSTLVTSWHQALPSQWRLVYQGAVLAGCAALMVFGARQLMPVLNPVTELFRSGDRPALEWMAENLSAGETVLINPFNWGYGVYAGSDGGYWIAPLTGLRTFPAPVLAGLGDPSQVQQASALAQKVIASGDRPQELWEIMKANEMRYIYTGVRGGPISPAALTGSPLFNVLYHQNGVWLFEALNP